jgi:hypothetical protein
MSVGFADTTLDAVLRYPVWVREMFHRCEPGKNWQWMDRHFWRPSPGSPYLKTPPPRVRQSLWQSYIFTTPQ